MAGQMAKQKTADMILLQLLNVINTAVIKFKAQ